VRWWDAVTGRRRPPRNDLDALFLIPSAAITLETTLGLRPAGVGGVCFRTAPGAAFEQMQRDLLALIDDTPDVPDDVEVSTDGFGFTWLVVRRDDTARTCTDLHAVNVALESQGFASGLLCSAVTFADTSRRVSLVYLYKQGTFYPFAPTGTRQRDNLLELSVRDSLGSELPFEADITRWLAIWDAPVL
jgi:hypothetical protein